MLNFGLFGGLSSPSSRRLIFLVLSGLSFFWSFRGLDFLPSSRALDFFCWSVRDLISWSFLGFDLLVPPGPTLVPSGVHFPCLFGGLIFFGSVGCPSFMIPFGDALLGPFGARLLTSPAHITGKGWSRVAGLVCCFFFFRISGLSVLTRAQAHCSCFFRPRCGWRILASGGAGLAVEFFGVSTGTGPAS